LERRREEELIRRSMELFYSLKKRGKGVSKEKPKDGVPVYQRERLCCLAWDAEKKKGNTGTAAEKRSADVSKRTESLGERGGCKTWEDRFRRANRVDLSSRTGGRPRLGKPRSRLYNGEGERISKLKARLRERLKH